MQQSIDTRIHPELGRDETARTLVVGIECRQVWKTLESPIRMRLLEMIRRLGSCTILELAEAAGTRDLVTTTMGLQLRHRRADDWEQNLYELKKQAGRSESAR